MEKREKLRGQVLTTASLINCNVGLGVLVVPIVAISSGFIPLLIITVVMALLAYYTAHLIVSHQGNSQNINVMMQKHFGVNSWWSKLYTISLMISILTLLIINFELLIRQSLGLLPILKESRFLYSFFLFVFLVIMTAIMKRQKISMSFLGIGVLGTTCLMGFFIWLIFSVPPNTQYQPQQKLEPVGKDFVSLISILITANSIHNVISPVLSKGVQPQSYARVIKLAFFGSAFIYLIAGLSCIGLLSRQPVSESPQTFYDYFESSGIAITMVYIIFTFRFLTVCPELCIILSQYFGQFVADLTGDETVEQDSDEATINTQEERTSGDDLSIKDVVSFIIIFGICFYMSTLHYNLKTMSALRGALISSIVTFIVPLVIHLKCKYFKQKQASKPKPFKIISSNQELEVENYCQKQAPPSKFTKGLQLVLIGFIFTLCFVCSIIQIYHHWEQQSNLTVTEKINVNHHFLRKFIDS